MPSTLTHSLFLSYILKLTLIQNSHTRSRPFMGKTYLYNNIRN
ncbi:hypothetical protein GLYMA_17G244432v4 [Glycine max]|nr:hypothetical protein GLYMA_17G244432v4 [Glycine max]KAH1119962.1 hypothetical protein GYH30_048359 [Glycine max]